MQPQETGGKIDWITITLATVLALALVAALTSRWWANNEVGKMMAKNTPLESFLVPIEVRAKTKEEASRIMEMILENADLAFEHLSDAHYVNTKNIDISDDSFLWEDGAKRLWPEENE